jgi:hypothetical protein
MQTSGKMKQKASQKQMEKPVLGRKLKNPDLTSLINKS